MRSCPNFKRLDTLFLGASFPGAPSSSTLLRSSVCFTLFQTSRSIQVLLCGTRMTLQTVGLVRLEPSLVHKQQTWLPKAGPSPGHFQTKGSWGSMLTEPLLALAAIPSVMVPGKPLQQSYSNGFPCSQIMKAVLPQGPWLVSQVRQSSSELSKFR